ncbi:MAG: FtsW/RodA/SpoVE family cell cycle protein [Anaerolineales bacterium]|nr:FtsW/RodA/SpoVE family cell cycle protein [Anaerolineales bacterium]
MSEQALPQFVEDSRPVAQSRPRASILQMDLYLLAVVGLLCAVGLLMVYSASIDASFLATEDSSTTYFFRRQLFPNLFVGIIALYGLARIDYRIWRRLSPLLMLAIIIALLLVLGYGDERLEARRSLLSGSYQPGEAAKLVVVIYMAAWLASKRQKIRNITYGLIPFTIMVGTVTVLIVLQPDISTAANILATTLTMFFLAGAHWLQLGALTGAALVAGWTISTQFEYAQRRINDHLAAIENLTLANDHVQAAIVAFLDGGLFGVGLGEGRQKYAIPFPHTDSVFAVIGEELGLFGCFIVIALYVLMVIRGFKIAREAPDAFGSLLASGIIIWLVYDALLNIAVMTALVPPTGVPLPFISFGGSTLVAAMAGIGLVLSVSRVTALTPPEERQAAWLPVVAEEKTKPEPQKAVKRPPMVDKRTVKKAQVARQRQRKEELERIRQEPRPESAPVNFDVALDTIDAPSTDAAPQDLAESHEEGTTVDPNSDLSGRDRRGRISRISCG